MHETILRRTARLGARCALLIPAFALALLANTSACGGQAEDLEIGITHQALVSPWVSDETDVGNCPSREAMTGSECRGRYCDDLRLHCTTFPGALNAVSSTTVWVEAGGQTRAHCPPRSWVTGVEARGDFSDDIRLVCSESLTGLGHGDACEWSGWYSEENTPFVAPVGWFVTAAECRNTHCDDVRYRMCQPTAEGASNSCAARCGRYDATATCQCDALCTSYRDCCDDRPRVCGL